MADLMALPSALSVLRRCIARLVGNPALRLGVRGAGCGARGAGATALRPISQQRTGQ